MPTAQRAPAAFLIRRGGERLLFDCAEGTQRQLQRSTVGLPDLETVFLTHFHADHYLGLPGMLKTFALRGRDETNKYVGGGWQSGLVSAGGEGVSQPKSSYDKAAPLFGAGRAACTTGLISWSPGKQAVKRPVRRPKRKLTR